LFFSEAKAQSVLFDFDNAPLHSPLPLDLTVGGITAHFSANPGYYNYSIQRADVLGFTPVGFAGYCIYPSTIYLCDLLVSFSQPLTSASILYAPEEYATDSSCTMRITAYLGTSLVGTNTFSIDPPGTWPTGTLAITTVQPFDNVVIHYDAPPPTGGDYGPIFMADNLLVTVASATPTATPETPTPTPTPGTPTPTPTPAPGTPTPTPTPTPTSGTPTPTPTPTPNPSPAQALNISTRMRVDTGNNVLIGGFIVTGTASKDVVVRGIGPSLGALGVPDALADPTLELHDSSGALLAQNDNWQDDPSQAAQLTTLGLALQDPNESGIVSTLQPGSYTAILVGKNQITGVGLGEIYDTSSGSASQLANISTRGFVLTGSNVMIGGFILGGNSNTHVVVRGIGPSLAQVGIPNFLADPTLELHDGNGALLVSNDNWQDDAASAAQLTTLGLAPQDPAESGIYVSLAPGSFTAIMAGKNGGTGVGLVEIYNVH
jgi:hypothetical protein